MRHYKCLEGGRWTRNGREGTKSRGSAESSELCLAIGRERRSICYCICICVGVGSGAISGSGVRRRGGW